MSVHGQETCDEIAEAMARMLRRTDSRAVGEMLVISVLTFFINANNLEQANEYREAFCDAIKKADLSIYFKKR